MYSVLRWIISETFICFWSGTCCDWSLLEKTCFRDSRYGAGETHKVLDLAKAGNTATEVFDSCGLGSGEFIHATYVGMW